MASIATILLDIVQRAGHFLPEEQRREAITYLTDAVDKESANSAPVESDTEAAPHSSEV